MASPQVAPPEVRNCKHPRCVICNVDALNKFDSDIFYFRINHQEFSIHANKLGFTIPQREFEIHRSKHIYIHKEIDIPKEAPASEILADMISALRAQLKRFEEAQDTETPEYTKKSELLKSLLELKGKFDGAFAQRVEVSTDFKSMMVDQLMASVKDSRGVKQVAKRTVITMNPQQEDAIPKLLNNSTIHLSIPVGKELALALKAVDEKNGQTQ